MTADTWLEKNAVDCVRLGARITPKACAMYREAEPVACKGCAGFGAVLDEGEAQRVAPDRPSRLFARKTRRIAPNKEKTMKFCEVGGCNGKHVARGLCKKHYALQYPSPSHKKATVKSVANKVEAAVAAVPAPPVNKICIEFSVDDQALFDALVISAKKNRRSVSDEMLFVLESTL